ncbi:MAG: 2-oxoglutarate ferredoxin oxidoreductase subunit beta, partial [Halobacteriales archaeon]
MSKPETDESDLSYELLPYLRGDQLPHTMCPGCGGGTVLNTFAKAVDEMDDLSVEDLLLVSGIGCSAWIPSPNFEADTLHTTHGRAVAFATGAKAGNPDRETVVLSGDGDLAGIGGNHLLHAARRNVDVTVVLVNNFTYGMT